MFWSAWWLSWLGVQTEQVHVNHVESLLLAVAKKKAVFMVSFRLLVLKIQMFEEALGNPRFLRNMYYSWLGGEPFRVEGHGRNLGGRRFHSHVTSMVGRAFIHRTDGSYSTYNW